LCLALQTLGLDSRLQLLLLAATARFLVAHGVVKGNLQAHSDVILRHSCQDVPRFLHAMFQGGAASLFHFEGLWATIVVKHGF
jgi:hypothetical protein